MEKDKHLGLRIDSETHKKLKSLAEFDGRSINGEILYPKLPINYTHNLV